jgi:hypothetical protein
MPARQTERALPARAENGANETESERRECGKGEDDMSREGRGVPGMCQLGLRGTPSNEYSICTTKKRTVEQREGRERVTG